MCVWSKVRLGEVLTQNQKYIQSPELRHFRRLFVKLYGKRHYLRREESLCQRHPDDLRAARESVQV